MLTRTMIDLKKEFAELRAEDTERNKALDERLKRINGSLDEVLKRWRR